MRYSLCRRDVERVVDRTPKNSWALWAPFKPYRMVIVRNSAAAGQPGAARLTRPSARASMWWAGAAPVVAPGLELLRWR